jgi:thiol:disulfide interchange protein
VRLERDEFSITYEAGKANDDKLLATIKEAGYEARLVDDRPEAAAASTRAPSGDDPPIFKEALARAKREQKPVVLDFYAEWCVPCKRMLRETFADPKVTALLERCVLVKIDTDRYPDLGRKYGVSGLPDLRFLAPDGTEKKRVLDYQDPAPFAKALEALLGDSPGAATIDK